MNKIIWVLGLVLLLVGCKTYKPTGAYMPLQYVAVDYSQTVHWAAHPQKMDESDRTPEGDTVQYQNAMADVFFIHPTTYTGDRKGQDQWNGPIDDVLLNKKTDEGAIRFQASAFNLAGRIFAPRYRQAHLNSYFTSDKISAKTAFDLAYLDVKSAFEYYLKNENNGRPIIIASHSQGTNHAERLLSDFFDGKPLQSQLVAAFLLGMPIKKIHFKEIFPCKDGSDTGCYVSWRTFKRGFELPKGISSDEILVTNPLSWNSDDIYMPKTLNKGSLLFKFDQVYDHLVDAQVNKDILWASKPKFKGSIFLRTKNYHPADVNFYYFSIRENAKNRVENHLKKK